MTAFEVFGPILIAWAVLVGFLGITREDFPGSKPLERLVGAVSVLLVVLAIGAAVYTASHEKKEGKQGAVPVFAV